jgi:glycosyltransferase involved in cell wall biosynthesis
MNKVSVVIPVYNSACFIEKTLDSVIGEGDEIIISDNASTDGTSDICLQYAAKYPEIKYIRQKENIGSGLNWHFCFNQALGEYTRLVGGHDMISRGSTQSLLEVMETNPDIAMVYPKYRVYLNPDYSSKYFETFSDGLIRDYQSDLPHVRLGRLIKEPVNIFEQALYKTDIVKKTLIEEHRVFSNPSEGCIYGYIMLEYKVAAEDRSINFRMLKYPPDVVKDVANRGWEYKKYNSYSYYIQCACELYDIARIAQLLPSTPVNFDKEILQVLLQRYRVPVWIKTSDISLENILPIVPGKEDLVHEVYALMLKYNKKIRSFYFLRRIVRGVLRRTYRLLKKIFTPIMHKLDEV